MTLSIFFLATFALIDSITGDAFSDGFNAPCGFAYDTGCKIGQLKLGEGAYDTATEVLGGYLSYIQGMTAGFACALCGSGFSGDGNTTQSGNQSECCQTPGPQCGNIPFQRAYNDVHPVSCELGYDTAKGRVDQYSLIILGGYNGIVLCGTEGLLKCSPFGTSGLADIPAEIANILGNIF